LDIAARCLAQFARCKGSEGSTHDFISSHSRSAGFATKSSSWLMRSVKMPAKKTQDAGSRVEIVPDVRAEQV
jgi:hypothetical protein